MKKKKVHKIQDKSSVIRSTVNARMCSQPFNTTAIYTHTPSVNSEA